MGALAGLLFLQQGQNASKRYITLSSQAVESGPLNEHVTKGLTSSLCRPRPSFCFLQATTQYEPKYHTDGNPLENLQVIVKCPVFLNDRLPGCMLWSCAAADGLGPTGGEGMHLSRGFVSRGGDWEEKRILCRCWGWTRAGAEWRSKKREIKTGPHHPSSSLSQEQLRHISCTATHSKAA